MYARLPRSPAASVAVTVNAELPAWVGVPVRAPAADRVSPAGRLPAVIANVNGPAAPPAAGN